MMYGEAMGDSAVTPSVAASVQHALMLRRLQRSQIDNALIRNKAQRFTALKTLRRSVELRRQLQQLQQQQLLQQVGATSGEKSQSTEDSDSKSCSSPLDPSVKALIDKLSEIAELLPYGYRGEQAPLDARPPPRQQQQQRNDASSSEQGEIVLAPSTSTTTSTGREGSQDLQNVPKSGDGDDDSGDRWNQSEARRNLGAATHQPGGVGLQEDEEMATILDGSNEDYVDTMDLAMHQQLLDLDSDVNSLFQDLEEQQQGPAKASKESELLKKTGARDNAATEEADAKKKQAEIARKKERAALLAQLESISGGKQHRLPRWRWAAEGVDNPDPDRVLKGKHLWRAAALLVIVFFVRPKRQLMQRKLRSKDRDTQDWNATLTIYFDRCQTWLLKATRVPVGNSLLKSSTLNFRLGRVDNKREAYGSNAQGAGNAGGGFVSALLKQVARGANHDNLALTLTRLKVHAKGVLRGLTQEMPPSDIMTFFSYLAGDGNYFPEGFFFDAETGVLSFDELGAVRNLAASTDPPDTLEDTIYALHPSGELGAELLADAQGRPEGFLETHHLGWLVHAGPSHGKGGVAEKPGNAANVVARPTDLRTAVLHGHSGLPGKLRPVYRHDASGQWLDTSLVEMLLTNYLMVRVLIPWILLYPRESGLIPSSGLKPSLLTHNCQVLASTMYLIVRVLRPELTPPNPETMRAAVVEETERAAKIAAGDDTKRDDEEGQKHIESDDGEESGSDDESNKDETQSQGNNREGESPDPKGSDGNQGGRRRKKKTGIRRRLSLAVRAPLKPRTVQQIMQQKRYVSVSDKQLVPGLLPDAYFLPFAEQMRPWVLELAAEFDGWIQRVVATVMSKVEGSVTRHERSPTT